MQTLKLRSNKASIPTLADESLDGMEAMSDEAWDKAEILNKFFTSTFTRELDDIPEFQDQGFSTILDDISLN